MPYVQDRTYRAPELQSYNDEGARIRIVPDRAADRNRQHILCLSVDDMQELRKVLDRMLSYAESETAERVRSLRAQVKEGG